MRRTFLAALAGALTLASPASAQLPQLPTETASLTASGTTGRTCHTRLLPAGTAGVAHRRFTAKAVGAANLRLAGDGRRGDWDLGVFDAAGRALGGSPTFGDRELVQRWVHAGDVLTVQACRRAGARASVPFTADLVLGTLPSLGAFKPQLLRVGISKSWQHELLEDLGLDVTHRRDERSVDVIVNGVAQLDLVKKTGFPYSVRVDDLTAYYAQARQQDAAAPASALPTGRSEYRAYEDFGTEMKALVAANPKLVKPVTLPGTSFQGRPMEGVEIADGVTEPEDGRPVSMVVALHHAREWPSAETAMEYMHHLVQGHGKDERVTSLLRKVRVVVVPMINPDAYVYTRGAFDTQDSTEYTALAATGQQAYRRKNCSGLLPASAPCDAQLGTDPNRNYGSGWGGKGASANRDSQTYRGPAPFSEPETTAVQAYGQTRQITNMITLHNVAALVLRPPGRSSDGLAPDEERLKALGDKIQSVTGYRSQYGWQLYDTSGTTEDWFYDAFGTFGYTIEIGPADGMFHMPYDIGVVNEWLGKGDREDGLKGVEGKGMKEALLLGAEQAADTTDHGVIAGRAPAGRVLKISKAFKSSTSPVCQVTVSFPVGFANPPLSEVTAERCEVVGDPILFDDKLETSMTVPAGGRFEYHVNPSTRPFVGRAGTKETFKLTCEDDGRTIESVDVEVPRGGRFTADLPCGGTLPAAQAPPGGCADDQRPQTTLKSVRLSRRRVSVRGISIDAGCAGVGRVVVAIGRQVRKNVCSFMNSRGRFGKARRCNRPVYLKAKGTGPWTFTRAARLRKGSYLVYTRAFDRKNNRERASLRVNGKRVRVR